MDETTDIDGGRGDKYGWGWGIWCIFYNGGADLELRGTISFTNSIYEIQVYVRRLKNAQATYSFIVCLCNSSALFYQGQ